MKNESDQLFFDLGPRVGELWVVDGEIVSVVRVGSTSFGRALPDCIEYIGLGYAIYDEPGRWWDIDYSVPSENPDPYWAPTGTSRCDKVYFKPWNGKGVFYATADGMKAAELIAGWRMVKTRSLKEVIEARLEKLFGRQVARDGFR